MTDTPPFHGFWTWVLATFFYWFTRMLDYLIVPLLLSLILGGLGLIPPSFMTVVAFPPAILFAVFVEIVYGNDHIERTRPKWSEFVDV